MINEKKYKMGGAGGEFNYINDLIRSSREDSSVKMILRYACTDNRVHLTRTSIRRRFPSFAREFISLLFRDVAQVIYELFGTRTHARIVLNIHRASRRGVEASRVPGIHHPLKRAGEGRGGKPVR